MTNRPDVDTKCFQLAADFLSELPEATKDDVWELADVIQRACEDACMVVEERSKTHRPPE